MPRAAQALVPRSGSSQEVGSEAYLNSTSQNELVLPVPPVPPVPPVQLKASGGKPEDIIKARGIRTFTTLIAD